ncbi:MAG: Mrp/NBP35 family ATP-binding protein [Parachlamydiaceae bacterium]|nr:Mrp/NBP35 family ATP-binding protein [Parachlamydiaceae bacterium]
MENLNPSGCKVFAVGSGKGGVGKSTIAVNFAVALAQKGLSVGLLDADVYGPSIPIMLGLRRLSPQVQRSSDGKEKVLPFTKFGIKSISIGFFIEEARSVMWRGPILHGTLKKMLNEVIWGDLDVLILDLPPGTGDIQISIAQLLKIDGAIIVTTPQEVAMLDAIKAINAFDNLEIPLVGIIENMAGFTVPETGETFHIFGQGKGQELASRFNTKLLGSIPLIPEIRQGGDEGFPVAFHQGSQNNGSHFHILAEHFIRDFLAIQKNPFK